MRQVSVGSQLRPLRLLIASALASLVPILAAYIYLILDWQYGHTYDPMLDNDEWMDDSAWAFQHLPRAYLVLTLEVIVGFVLVRIAGAATRLRIGACFAAMPVAFFIYVFWRNHHVTPPGGWLPTVLFLIGLLFVPLLIAAPIARKLMAHNNSLDGARGG